MQLNQIVFAKSYFLWGLLLLPIVVIAVKLYKAKQHGEGQLSRFADPLLLPHLLLQPATSTASFNLLYLWSMLWILAIIALANPRWKYVDYESYQPGSALVVILDLAQTMQAEDQTPNRLVRAKQQIEDILQLGKGLRIGLIAYAAYPHLVSPITDDLATILYLLPALDPDLISKQGKDLNSALIMAQQLLQREPGTSKHILVVSDGDLANNFQDTVASIKKAKIKIHIAAVGTEQGAPFKDSQGALYREHGKIVLSKLNADLLENLVADSKGMYWLTNHQADNTRAFVKSLLHGSSDKTALTSKTVRQWEDEFYWFVIPMLGLAILLQRKCSQLKLMVLLFGVSLLAIPNTSRAFDLLHNSEQQGAILFNNGDYETAAHTFKDPYRQGVAFYKAGKFNDAELAFKNSIRPEVKLDAAYNLGNALLKQAKYHAAITAYEQAIAMQPDHKAAQENLAIAKKLLSKQEEEQAKSPPKDHPKCNNKQQSPDSQDGNDATNSTQPKQSPAKDAANNSKTNDNATDKTKAEQNAQASKEPTAANDKLAAIKEPIPQPQEPASAAEDDQAKHLEKSHANVDDVGQVDKETKAWLQRINSDVKVFLKNKFLIEEKQAK